MYLEVNAKEQTWLEKLVFILHEKQTNKTKNQLHTYSHLHKDETKLKIINDKLEWEKDCRISTNFVARKLFRRCHTKQGV